MAKFVAKTDIGGKNGRKMAKIVAKRDIGGKNGRKVAKTVAKTDAKINEIAQL